MQTTIPSDYDLPATVQYDLDCMNAFADLEEDCLSKSYQYFVDQNQKLQQDNHTLYQLVSQLKTELSQWQLKSTKQDVIIRSLQQQLAVQQSTFDVKFNDFLVCAHDNDQKKTQEIVSLKTRLNEIHSKLSKLHHKYDGIKIDYLKLHQTYSSLKNENKWKTWKWHDIYEWIRNTINDDRLNKYAQILYDNLKAEDIAGSNLPSLNEDDFYYLGIKNYFDRQLLCGYIQKLVNPHCCSESRTDQSSIDFITNNCSTSSRSPEFRLPSPVMMSSISVSPTPFQLNEPATQQQQSQLNLSRVAGMDWSSYLNNLISTHQPMTTMPSSSSPNNDELDGEQQGQIMHPGSFTIEQLKKMRIRQKNIVYVVGLPVSLCNAKLLKSKTWFGKFGPILRICFNTSPKCVQANSIPTFITYQSEHDALEAIQKMNLYCLEDGTRLKTNYGRTKYCPTFAQGQQCVNGKCKFLHEWAKVDDIITEQEINDFNAIRAGPPSRLHNKK